MERVDSIRIGQTNTGSKRNEQVHSGILRLGEVRWTTFGLVSSIAQHTLEWNLKGKRLNGCHGETSHILYEIYVVGQTQSSDWSEHD